MNGLRKLYIYTMEYYSTIKKNTFESVLMSSNETVLMRWMKSKPERKSPIQYTNAYIYGI